MNINIVMFATNELFTIEWLNHDIMIQLSLSQRFDREILSLILIKIY